MPLSPLVALLLLLASAHALALAPEGPLLQGAQLAFGAMLVLWPLWPCVGGDLAPEERGVTWPTPETWVPGLVLALALLPLFHLGVEVGLWPARGTDRSLELAALLPFAARHLLEVILPEEVFFRGYLQTELDDGRGPELMGIRWHRGIWLQALGFGLVHVVARGGAWVTMDRSLPGVAFGYLREKTGSLWAPALFHLACNLYVYTLGT